MLRVDRVTHHPPDIHEKTNPRRGPVDVLPLHGSLDAEAQDRAVLPGETGRRHGGSDLGVATLEKPRRRVILATNVAEASITVQGVTSVVDSGLRKRPPSRAPLRTSARAEQVPAETLVGRRDVERSTLEAYAK
eukprot:Skav212227  [mRNA]  locus=scaffold4279:20186:24078:+ [translate_table: standard]